MTTPRDKAVEKAGLDNPNRHPDILAQKTATRKMPGKPETNPDRRE